MEKHRFMKTKVLQNILELCNSCTHRHSHYGLRDTLINNNVVEERYLRCNNVETWDHVVKCPHTIEIRKEFIKTLPGKLLQKKPDNADANLMMACCKDVLRHLEEDIEDEDECETTQHCIGMKEIFRGHIVNDWARTNTHCKIYCTLNKTLA